MDHSIALIASAFYILAIATIIPGLYSRTGIKAKFVLVFAASALLFHARLLTDLVFHSNGQNLSILNVGSIVGFMISFLMTATMTKTRLWFALPIVYVFTALNLSAAAFLSGTFMTHIQDNLKLLTHISLALFSYAILTIGALYALQLAWLDSKLKQKKTLAINPNFPPLMMVERQLFNIIILGQLLLTGTLFTGLVFIEDPYVKGQTHKTVLSFIAWIVYAVLLWGHYQKGWRGKRVVWFTLLGAFILTLGYFGSRFVKEIVLHH